VESILSTWQSEITDALNVKAAAIIFKYLPRAMEDGTNQEAREKLHIAATIAGLAFSNAHVIIGHSMAHVLGSTFHVPHSVGVSLFLPFAVQFNLNDPASSVPVQRLGDAAKQIGLAQWDDDDNTAAWKFADKIKELQLSLQLPDKIADLGIDKEEFDSKLEQMAKECLESSSTSTSFRTIDADQFKSIFQYAWDGKPIDF